MKTKVLLAALASMALVGCTNNEQLLDETKKGQEIRFAVAPQTPQARAEHDLDQDKPYTGYLKIWAWEDGTNKVIIPGELYKASTMTFDSGKIYYYPVNGANVDFLAVPMYGDEKVNPYFVEPVRTADGKTTFTFNVGHEGHNGDEHKIDLMTSEIVTQNTGIVGFVLRHLTTKLNLRIEQSQRQNDASICSVTLSKVQFQGLKNKGYVELADGWTAVNGGNDCFWTQVEDESPCVWDLLNTNHTLATVDLEENVNDFVSTGSFHVVPQHFVDNLQKIYLEYSIVTQYRNGQPTVTEYFKKSIDFNDISGVGAWAMNKNVSYLISINPLEEHHKITFQVFEEVWGEQSGSVIVTPSDSEQNKN